LTDEIFEKIMNHGKQSGPAVSPSVPGPASMPSITAQPTGFNPNAPRGPLAPVASNAPLLNRKWPLEVSLQDSHVINALQMMFLNSCLMV
jgi:hypothetical protein